MPARKLGAQKGIALCSLYLLFGIALLAMSFNLVQEEVINNVKSVAKRLGIIKETDDEEEAEDYDEYDPEYEEEVYENEPKLWSRGFQLTIRDEIEDARHLSGRRHERFAGFLGSRFSLSPVENV